MQAALSVARADTGAACRLSVSSGSQPAAHSPSGLKFSTSWVPLNQALGWKLEQGGSARVSIVPLDVQAEMR